MKVPGVYVEEFERGPRPIDGVSTSTAGMVGETERGPVQPRLVTSWSEYEQWFGGAVSGAYLPFAVQGFFENGGQRLFVARVVGAGTTPQVADVVGDRQRPADERTGLAALEDIGEISLLLVPDEIRDGTGAITGAVINQCERLKDRFAIVSAPGHVADVSSIRPPRDTACAAFYYPWIRIVSAGSKDSVLMPASGHIAGIYARTDLERGVHKPPANEVVRGLDCDGKHDPLEFSISKSEQEVLNPRGVNVIRDFRSEGRGVRVWGARTMSSDPEWKYISVRRFFIFVEESIDEGTRWVVFEPNSEATWSIVRRTVTDFLRRLWLNGTLVGVTEDEAFFVKCDRTTMTQDDIDNGRLICLIGMAPLRPAEFVIFRIGQKTADAAS